MSKMFSELSQEVTNEIRDPIVDARRRIDRARSDLESARTFLQNLNTNTTALRNSVNTLASDNPSDAGIQALKALMDRYMIDGTAQFNRVNAYKAAIDNTGV